MDNSSIFINVSYIYQKIYDLLNAGYLPGQDATLSALSLALDSIKPVSVVLSLLFLTGVIYSMIRTQALIREAEMKVHVHAGEAHGAEGARGEAVSDHYSVAHSASPTTNKRWEKIVEHINSSSSGDWRLAILECDIILDEMLIKMSYRGETLSDKLKAVEKSDFLSIDKAWEAHRVRNSIAHEGSNFQITDREASRVVSLYEEVFKEFHYI